MLGFKYAALAVTGFSRAAGVRGASEYLLSFSGWGTEGIA